MRSISILGLCGCVAVAGLIGCNAQSGSTQPAEQKSSEAPADVKEQAPAQPAESTDSSEAANPRVEFVVEPQGRFVVELYPDRAPVTVENFLKYVDEGFYDGTLFHRIGRDFMVQGGGFTAINQKKTDGAHDPIRNESPGGMSNERGTLAMARIGGRPDSATCEFFINVVDNPRLNHPSYDGWGYAVFARVVEGMDVVDKIRNVETRVNPANPGDGPTMPVEPPVIKSARCIER